MRQASRPLILVVTQTPCFPRQLQTRPPSESARPQDEELFTFPPGARHEAGNLVGEGGIFKEMIAVQRLVEGMWEEGTEKGG